MTESTKAHIKDLELQIDYLCAWQPQGLHWKLEYHAREEYLNAFLADETTPQEIVDKIFRIQNKIYQLREGEPQDQSYLIAQEPENKERTIKINGLDAGELVLLGEKKFATYSDW